MNTIQPQHKDGWRWKFSREQYVRKYGRLPDIGGEERRRLRHQLNRQPVITSRFELQRLRQRLTELNQAIALAVNGERQRLCGLRAHCEKAIAGLNHD